MAVRRAVSDQFGRFDGDARTLHRDMGEAQVNGQKSKELKADDDGDDSHDAADAPEHEPAQPGHARRMSQRGRKGVLPRSADGAKAATRSGRSVVQADLGKTDNIGFPD